MNAGKHHAHPRHVNNLHWALNPNVLPDIWDYNSGSPSSTVNNDQIAYNMSDLATKPQSSFSGADKSTVHCEIIQTSPIHQP